MKQQLIYLKNQAAARVLPQLSAAKNLVQKLGSKAHTALAASYVKHPYLTMLGLRAAPRVAVIGVGLLAGTFTLEGLLHHDFFSGTASADACQTGYYETDTGQISSMSYSDGPDGVRGTGDDILQVEGLTYYPIDFRAEDGIPPETLQQYNSNFSSGDYAKVEMCTTKGGIAGILSRTHYGISMEHFEAPKPAGNNSIDPVACLIAFGVASLMAFGLLGAPYLMDRYSERKTAKRNKNRPDRLEPIKDHGDFEAVSTLKNPPSAGDFEEVERR